jgi:RNA polymerase sigma-70 factor (ECF subfamily)
MIRASAQPPLRESPYPRALVSSEGALSFEEIYREHAPFVWRTLRALGVPPSTIEDAVQDLFVVVHRRLPEFEGRAAMRTWLFEIALRVARDHRRAELRRGVPEALDEALPCVEPTPAESATAAEALRLVERALDTLDEERREVFVLAEIEQLTAPEMATVLHVPINTVYSRLRRARGDFEQAFARQTRGVES